MNWLLWITILTVTPSLSASICIPKISGEWWQIAGDPALGELTQAKQQPVDFGIWRAADGRWQLWSCIRATREPGKTRLFYRWESQDLTGRNWNPMGIAMQADPEVGETPGSLQAPYVFKEAGLFYLFYGDWESIRLATSRDGKLFQRQSVGPSTKSGLFSEGRGNNTRDPMVLRIGNRWHCYYTAFPRNLGSVYCRTSDDLSHWSESRQVAFGGEAGTNAFSAECPFVVEQEAGHFYLFRTQRYGSEAITRVYHSTDPLDFGVNNDLANLVTSLPVAAPEIFQHEGQWFIAALLPTLKGIQLARLDWISKPADDPQSYPSVACTPQELTRLRTAYQRSDSDHEVVARRVEQADVALKAEVVFPPEGGQHNQWYQCDQCQLALKTVDATHHRCPKCGTVYSGYPYDNVVYSGIHSRLTRWMWVCAWAYAVTGEEKYARRAREILIGYAQRYLHYPYHSNTGKMTDPQGKTGGHVFEQTLNEASWMEEVCEAYDLLRPSQVLTPDDHKAIREDLLLPVYENIAKHKAGKSNWQTYHDAAFMLIGGVLNRPDLVRQAIEDKENGFSYQMQASVLPGGMWYENSWGYHFYTLGAVERIVETGRRLGLDLYSTPQVKGMFTVAFDYQMGDGTLPRFGDATTTRIPGGLYEAAYHQWRDPRFLGVLPGSPTWDSVLYGRTEKPIKAPAPLQGSLQLGAGHAILRVGDSTAALTFGPFGGSHGHFDKLSFVYFSQGKELGYDPGRARSQAYRLPVHKNWYRATISHNTVLVDRASQQGAEGQHEFFLNTPELSAVAAHTELAYPGLVHRRLLVLRPGFLIVADVLAGNDGKTHTFDWLYHNRGDAISSPAAVRESTAPAGQGFGYFDQVRRGETNGPIKATVAMQADEVLISLNGEPGSEVITGTGVGESVLDRVPVLVVSRHGRSARFAAAIELAPKRQSGEIAGVEIRDDESGGSLVHVLLRNQGEELYAYNPAGTQRTVGGIRTESKLLCLQRKNGQAYRELAEAK
jgi:hypothetical protein